MAYDIHEHPLQVRRRHSSAPSHSYPLDHRSVSLRANDTLEDVYYEAQNVEHIRTETCRDQIRLVVAAMLA